MSNVYRRRRQISLRGARSERRRETLSKRNHGQSIDVQERSEPRRSARLAQRAAASMVYHAVRNLSRSASATARKKPSVPAMSSSPKTSPAKATLHCQKIGCGRLFISSRERLSARRRIIFSHHEGQEKRQARRLIIRTLSSPSRSPLKIYMRGWSAKRRDRLGSVIPAKTGIQANAALNKPGFRLRGNEESRRGVCGGEISEFPSL